MFFIWFNWIVEIELLCWTLDAFWWRITKSWNFFFLNCVVHNFSQFNYFWFSDLNAISWLALHWRVCVCVRLQYISLMLVSLTASSLRLSGIFDPQLLLAFSSISPTWTPVSRLRMIPSAWVNRGRKNCSTSLSLSLSLLCSISDHRSVIPTLCLSVKICLSLSLSLCLSVSLSVWASLSVVYLSFHIYLSVHLSVSFFLSNSVPVCLSVMMRSV